MLLFYLLFIEILVYYGDVVLVICYCMILFEVLVMVVFFVEEDVGVKFSESYVIWWF